MMPIYPFLFFILNTMISPSQGDPLLTENHLPGIRMMMEKLYDENKDISMTGYCGNWQEQYITKHKQILNRNLDSRKRRIIMFICHPHLYSCGGLGDQLIGIMATFLIALLTNRAFVINYPEFTQSFDPVAIDWRYKGDVYLGNYTYIQFNSLHRMPFRKIDIKQCAEGKHTIYISMMQMGWKNLKQKFEAFFRLTKNYKTVMVRANHGIYSYFASGSTWMTRKLQEKGFDDTNKPGCLLRFLLKPNSEIIESVREIEQHLINPKVFSVCIHLRPFKGRHVDDSVFFSNRGMTSSMDNTNFVFDCAQSISNYYAESDQDVKWFLMSSSSWLKQKIYEKYPDRILKTNIIPRHVDKINHDELTNALKDTVKEWYLFSKCNKYVLISSGLSKTSIAYSLNVNSTFMFPHNVFAHASEEGLFDWQTYCNPNNPTSTREMANEWSHL